MASDRTTTSYEEWQRAKEPSALGLLYQRIRSRSFRFQPLISVVMPVYNVEPLYLRSAVASVLAQTYPRWELCIVDDASSDPLLRQTLGELADQEDRISVRFSTQNVGIAQATNKAVAMSKGSFVAFLDDDDELAPEALFRVVKELNRGAKADLIYSDEDKLEVDSTKRVEPFFKPHWSPELLTQMNYISHLTVISRDLLDRVGGLRTGFEGSQDHDLVLRASAAANEVRHIPRILYHWRKIPGSAAMSGDAKGYAHESGRRAVAEAIASRGIEADVEVVQPGRYRLRHLPEPPPFEIVLLDPGSEVVQANSAAASSDKELLFFASSSATPPDEAALKAMASYAMYPEAAMVGGVSVDPDGVIVEAGLVVGQDGSVAGAFRGQRFDEPFYFHLARAVRECTAVSLTFMMMRRSIWEGMGGFDISLPSPYSEVDLGLRALNRGYASLCLPRVMVVPARAGQGAHPKFRTTIRRQLKVSMLQGDRYFPPDIDPHFDQVRHLLRA